jgi:hypothetical protein
MSNYDQFVPAYIKALQSEGYITSDVEEESAPILKKKNLPKLRGNL